MTGPSASKWPRVFRQPRRGFPGEVRPTVLSPWAAPRIKRHRRLSECERWGGPRRGPANPMRASLADRLQTRVANRHLPQVPGHPPRRSGWRTGRLNCCRLNTFMSCFTSPSAIGPIAPPKTRRRSTEFCSKAVAEDVCSRSPPIPQHLGAEIGSWPSSTPWGQNLQLHPSRALCRTRVAGLAADRCTPGFFLSAGIFSWAGWRVLSRVFRGQVSRAAYAKRPSIGDGSRFHGKPQAGWADPGPRFQEPSCRHVQDRMGCVRQARAVGRTGSKSLKYLGAVHPSGPRAQQSNV